MAKKYKVEGMNIKENKVEGMNIKENKEEEKFSIYGVITLIILVMYIIGLGYFLFESHKTIKNTYLEVEKKRINNVSIQSQIEKLNIEKINVIFSFDLESDDSLTKFVNSSVSFNKKTYVPKNLILFDNTYIVDTKGYSKLRQETLGALVKLNSDFYKIFNKNVIVISGYRSYDYQRGIKDGGCPDNLCAKAGFSEHQSGLAVDLFEASTNYAWENNKILTEYYNWLSKNAHDYGFHNTYQKGLEIDGYEIEPWHWRYVGVDLASYLKDNDLTIAEFYNNK